MKAFKVLTTILGLILCITTEDYIPLILGAGMLTIGSWSLGLLNNDDRK